MAENVRLPADPPGWRDEQALIECLEELREQASAVKESVRGVNLEGFVERTGLVLDAVADVLALHLPEPRNGVVGDLAVLERATDLFRVPRIDPELGERTDALDRLRSATGLLLRAIQDARRAAETARGPDAIPMQTAAIDAGSVRAMLQRLNRVEITLAKVARERDTAPEFVQQNGLVNLYVRKMRVKLDLAQLQMTIGDETFDLGALTSAVEAMGDITARFETGVRAWTGRVSALLTSSTENVAEAVRRVVRGARTLGKMVVRDPRVAGSEMVLIRTGTFIMGIPEAESKREGTEDWDVHARPLHRVTISRSFLLRRYPVTRGEFALFITETKRDWRSPEFEQTDRHPAVLVGYDDAVAYAAWLSQRTGHRYRLPSESEWEYACRAGTQTARYWGDVADPNMANFDSNGTKEVGSYPANPWGLCDMIGNGYEWVEDRWHDTYEGAPKDGSAWTTGIDTRRVVRGGSRNQDYKYLRSGNRGLNGRPPSPWVGFRLARDL